MMPRRITMLLLFSLVAATSAAELRVPSGFAISEVTATNRLRFPMFGTLDDQRHLYIAESSGLDLYEEVRKQTRRCRISVLEDNDGDGFYEQARVFADELVFPMGLVWREGKLYVADPPDLITLEDT